MTFIIGFILCVLAVFLILLVLVQRGRGGGLTGALGGVGGSSAFGAKAGDVFTKITVVAAFVWIVTCVGAAYWAGHRSDLLGDDGPAISAPIGGESSLEQLPSSDTDDSAGAADASSAEPAGEAGADTKTAE